jgi:hypothetical protein
MLKPHIFVDILKKGIDNNCYRISKDASEDVISLIGDVNDDFIIIERAREVKALEKGPANVRTADLRPEDLILVHYHCGISPEPSAIDIDTMSLALRVQLLATIPGRPRVFGIASPSQSGRSFCVDLALYEPVPSMSVGYNVVKVSVKDYKFVRIRKKAFVSYEVEDDEVIVYGEPCTVPERGCTPYRLGSNPEISLEDFIFIASYSINTKLSEFLYIKLTADTVRGYAIKVFNLDIKKAVIRGIPWRI